MPMTLREMTVREEIAAAVTEHGKWIVSLSEALESLANGSSVQCQDFLGRTRAADACCLGQWLCESTIPESARQSAHYKSIRELHRRFHQAAAEVITLALAGDADASAHLLETTLCALSKQLVAALDAWGRSPETA